MAAGQFGYLLETVMLIKRQFGKWLDVLTPLVELGFWILLSVFAFIVIGTGPCSKKENFFTCVDTGVIHRGRWSGLLYVVLGKLIVDTLLFILFWLIQKRKTNITHG